MKQPDQEFTRNDPSTAEDEKFDLIYPLQIRQLSSIFWTPVDIAAEAAKLLVTTPGTHVLDIGCAVGKFCLVGAQFTEGRFTGIEQRRDLMDAARRAACNLQLGPAVKFIHADVMDVPFSDYDAFYLFNPFEENMFQAHKIDSAVRSRSSSSIATRDTLPRSSVRARSAQGWPPTWVTRTRSRRVTRVSGHLLAMT